MVPPYSADIELIIKASFGSDIQTSILVGLRP